jgi:hypothetical protein
MAAAGPGPGALPPTIEIMPQGGFAARLRAAASAITFADQEHAPLAITWVNELNIFAAPAALLFDLSALPYWVAVQDALTPPDSIWGTARRIERQEDFPYYLQTLGWRRPIRVISGVALVQDFTDSLRLFQPAPEIATLRTQVFSQIMGRTLVGVHIRAAGGTQTTYYSPPAAFWSAMAAAIAADPSTLFYVASDTQAERTEALARFPDHVVLGFASLLGRNDPFGSFQDAVDFFCLTACTKVLCSYGAGFGQLAAQYAGVPTEIITAP